MAFYSWPSLGTTIGYTADEATIEASEPFIAEFLARFAAESGARHIHIIAHSMGNRGLLRAFHRIVARPDFAGKGSLRPDCPGRARHRRTCVSRSGERVLQVRDENDALRFVKGPRASIFRGLSTGSTHARALRRR